MSGGIAGCHRSPRSRVSGRVSHPALQRVPIRSLVSRVLVYFGYPQAHEDEAERAVRAGSGTHRGAGCPQDARSAPNPRRHCAHRLWMTPPNRQRYLAEFDFHDPGYGARGTDLTSAEDRRPCCHSGGGQPNTAGLDSRVGSRPVHATAVKMLSAEAISDERARAHCQESLHQSDGLYERAV
jgi:hypothetical protein